MSDAWSTPSDDFVDTVSEVESAPEPEAKSAEGSKKTTRKRTPATTKAVVTAVASKTIEVRNADKQVREITAKVLGSKAEDVLTVTVDTFGSDGSALAAVSTLIDMADLPAMRCGAVAASLSKPELRRMWDILGAVGFVEGTPPSDQIEAAMTVAECVQQFDDATLTKITNVQGILTV